LRLPLQQEKGMNQMHEQSPQENVVLQINPPFAYGAVVPLLKTHRVKAAGQRVPALLAASNAIPLSMAEMPRAARDYPIVFASGDGGKTFGVVAVLGLAEGENLFVQADGSWASSAYQPAYLRRHPFCMAVVRQDGQAQDERVVCIEQDALDDAEGLMIERPDGTPLSWWNERLRLLQEYEVDLARTRQMCDWVQRLDVLEPFSAQAVCEDGEVLNLNGMYRVNEDKLAALNADDLRGLISKGVMGRLYAHMISLDNLAVLLDRRKARPAVGTA
jgi:hypothetical protein